jgi:hypothetical protein
MKWTKNSFRCGLTLAGPLFPGIYRTQKQEKGEGRCQLPSHALSLPHTHIDLSLSLNRFSLSLPHTQQNAILLCKFDGSSGRISWPLPLRKIIDANQKKRRGALSISVLSSPLLSLARTHTKPSSSSDYRSNLKRNPSTRQGTNFKCMLLIEFLVWFAPTWPKNRKFQWRNQGQIVVFRKQWFERGDFLAI